MAINEKGNLKNPPPSDPKELAKQEDELFQRSRLVNCGYFMKVILGDYVGAILGLIRDGNTWRLDPLTVRPLSLLLSWSRADLWTTYVLAELP